MKALLSTWHSLCRSMSTLLAHDHAGEECPTCQACHQVWDTDKTPPRAPATDMGSLRRRSADGNTGGASGGDRNILVGDLVVTAVAEHYAIGTMLADGKTQEFLGSQPTQADALQLACGLAGAKHRVFLYWSAGTNDYFLFDCASVDGAK